MSVDFNIVNILSVTDITDSYTENMKLWYPDKKDYIPDESIFKVVVVVNYLGMRQTKTCIWKKSEYEKYVQCGKFTSSL